MIRKIITIDEDKCDGCGLCIPNCAEGALQIIDGKARLVSDLFCDGLGACLGFCPQDAITVVERMAEPYNERMVIDNMIPQGQNVIKAHLKHLLDHNELNYLNEAVNYLTENKINVPLDSEMISGLKIKKELKENIVINPKEIVELNNWPIQLHLINPMAQTFSGSDILLAADCVGYASNNFHSQFLKNKALVIACPKLDSGKEVYLKKLISLIDDSRINSLTVAIMEVPCCGGLLQLAKQAVQMSEKKIPLNLIIISIKGEILLKEEL